MAKDRQAHTRPESGFRQEDWAALDEYHINKFSDNPTVQLIARWTSEERDAQNISDLKMLNEAFIKQRFGRTGELATQAVLRAESKVAEKINGEA